MASNAHFLPMICLAISSSWPNNVQSPNLKRKLVDLAKSPTFGQVGVGQSNGDVGTLLKVVVETRLWSMMQKQLYDHSAIKSLPWGTLEKDSASLNDAGFEQEDLFQLLSTSTTTDGESHIAMLDVAGIEEGTYSSDFDDLLDGDYDEEILNLDDIERERTEIEHQMDYMLLGDGQYDGLQDSNAEDLMLLLDDTTREEIMLI
jgi:hypothetical protein